MYPIKFTKKTFLIKEGSDVCEGRVLGVLKCLQVPKCFKAVMALLDYIGVTITPSDDV